MDFFQPPDPVADREEAVLEAVVSASPELLKSALASRFAGAGLSARSIEAGDGSRPLHVAAGLEPGTAEQHRAAVEIVRLLLNAGADVAARTDANLSSGASGMLALHVSAACASDDDERLALLCDFSPVALLNARCSSAQGSGVRADNGGDTALLAATLAGNKRCARCLLERGADPWLRNERSTSALIHVCADPKGRLEELMTLIKHRALDEPRGDADRALIRAADTGTEACIRVLVASGGKSRAVLRSAPAPTNPRPSRRPLPGPRQQRAHRTDARRLLRAPRHLHGSPRCWRW